MSPKKNFAVSVFFPLTSVGSVRKLFEYCISFEDPDLAFLSVVIGALESNLTQFRHQQSEEHEEEPGCSEDLTTANLPLLQPPLDYETVNALCTNFESVIRGYCDVSLLEAAAASSCSKSENIEDTRNLIKHIADIIWNTLSKSHYKDRPHLQSIYSYLTGNKLDCFGVAYTVVAACQLLKIKGVHLALSEDHAWVVFGENGTETAEVTWHGKGNEDKRGQPVDIIKARTAWLYLAGQPVVCDRYMEAAALISSMNPAITANSDSLEVAAIQQELLWLLYDRGHLKNYPMALGNLGDLEEIHHSLGRPECIRLFEEAIAVNREVYSNHHVYPYTYQAGYYYRSQQYKQALEAWANSADVIKLYKYSKDDEEIYKEFMEIANELIPHVVRTESDLIHDPECFAYILRFYDGICCWEQGSPTPVLHIGWAKPMVATCCKFDPSTRALVDIPIQEDDYDDNDEDEEEGTLENNNYKKCDMDITEKPRACDNIEDSMINSLSSSCHNRLLNVDFLLGKDKSVPFLDLTDELLADPLQFLERSAVIISEKKKGDQEEQKRVKVNLRLHSAKMKGLKTLLCAADKLNTSAIQLQLTAQSQTEFEDTGRPKRSRRE